MENAELLELGISDFNADRLWSELNLKNLLDDNLPNLRTALLHDPLLRPQKVVDTYASRKHKKMIAKPSYNVLVNRYDALPHDPVTIKKSSIDRLSDPLRGRYSALTKWSDNSPKPESDQHNDDEKISCFHLTETKTLQSTEMLSLKKEKLKASKLKSRLQEAALFGMTEKKKDYLPNTKKSKTSLSNVKRNQRMDQTKPLRVIQKVRFPPISQQNSCKFQNSASLRNCKFTKRSNKIENRQPPLESNDELFSIKTDPSKKSSTSQINSSSSTLKTKSSYPRKTTNSAPSLLAGLERIDEKDRFRSENKTGYGRVNSRGRVTEHRDEEPSKWASKRKIVGSLNQLDTLEQMTDAVDSDNHKVHRAGSRGSTGKHVYGCDMMPEVKRPGRVDSKDSASTRRSKSPNPSHVGYTANRNRSRSPALSQPKGRSKSPVGITKRQSTDKFKHGNGCQESKSTLTANGKPLQPKLSSSPVRFESNVPQESSGEDQFHILAESLLHKSSISQRSTQEIISSLEKCVGSGSFKKIGTLTSRHRNMNKIDELGDEDVIEKLVIHAKRYDNQITKVEDCLTKYKSLTQDLELE